MGETTVGDHVVEVEPRGNVEAIHWPDVGQAASGRVDLRVRSARES
jgi:hypothetical protein